MIWSIVSEPIVEQYYIFSVSQRISQLLQNFFLINWMDNMTLWGEFWMEYAICLLIPESKVFISQLEIKAIRCKCLRDITHMKFTYSQALISQWVNIKLILIALADFVPLRCFEYLSPVILEKVACQYYFHFADKKIKLLKGKVTCPRSCSL